MADFKIHSVLGTGSAICYAAGSYFFEYVSLRRAFLGAAIFAMASVLPDLDSETGTAKRFLFDTLAVFLPALLITQISFDTAEHTFFIILCLYLLVRYPVQYLFEHLTTHRGIFHSIPAACVFGLGIALLFVEAPTNIRVFYAAGCAGGYMLHLIIDEIWSFGFFGLGAKKSFGSALKLYDKSWFPTVLMYLALGALVCLIFIPDLLQKMK